MFTIEYPDSPAGPWRHVEWSKFDRFGPKQLLWRAAGMQVNTPNKDAFIAASNPVYDEFGKEVSGAQQLIEKSIALGK